MRSCGRLRLFLMEMGIHEFIKGFGGYKGLDCIREGL